MYFILIHLLIKDHLHYKQHEYKHRYNGDIGAYLFSGRILPFIVSQPGSSDRSNLSRKC